jgi:hypothetical protein
MLCLKLDELAFD